MSLESVTIGELLILISAIGAIIAAVKTMKSWGDDLKNNLLKETNEEIKNLKREVEKSNESFLKKEEYEKNHEELNKAVKKLDGCVEEIRNTLDLQQTRSFLMERFDEVRKLHAQDDEIPTSLKEQIGEMYDHYLTLGGNSYIKGEHDRLEREGLI